MKTKPKRIPKTEWKMEMVDFEVEIPSLNDEPTTKVTIQVPVRINPVSGDQVLTAEAHELIEKCVARHLGIMSPTQIKELRQTLGETQKRMSELVQCGEKSWARWESGNSRVSRMVNVTLCALRDGKITVEYLESLAKGSEAVLEREEPVCSSQITGWNFEMTESNESDFGKGIATKVSTSINYRAKHLGVGPKEEGVFADG